MLSTQNTSELETAIDTNAKFLWVFSKYFAFPFEVDLTTKRLKSTSSPWRLWYLHLTLASSAIKTVWVHSLLVLSLTHDQFFREVQLPVHVVQSAGYIACTGWIYLLLVKHRTLFVTQWNCLMKHRNLIKERNFKYFLLNQFPFSACGGFFVLMLAMAFDPTWLLQVRFGVHYLRESGYLENDWLFLAATALAMVFDFVAFMSSANIVALTWFSHALFFEVWIAAIGDVSKRIGSTTSNSGNNKLNWSKVTEVVLLLRYFNMANSTTVFLSKGLNMTLAVTTYTCLVLMKFEHWYVTAFLVYIAAVNLTCYPLLYSNAFKVTARLEELKRQVLVSKGRYSGEVRRQVIALSTKGVSVGSFRTFERESVLLFLFFIKEMFELYLKGFFSYVTTMQNILQLASVFCTAWVTSTAFSKTLADSHYSLAAVRPLLNLYLRILKCLRISGGQNAV